MDLRKSHAAPTNLPMHPKNMPYYCGPCVQPVTKTGKSADTLHIQSRITVIVMSTRNGNIALYNVPNCFGHVTPHRSLTAPPSTLLNLEFASYAFHAMYFCWAVYLFSNRHFSSTIQSQSLPFHISMVCDPSNAGRSLFVEFALDAQVFSSGNDFLHHIRASGETSIIHGYLINSYCFLTSNVTSAFWKLQLAIIAQLRLIRLLLIVVAIVIPDQDGRRVKAFIRGLMTAHWKVLSRDVSFVEIGNSVVDSCTVIIAVHLSSASVIEPIVLKTLPTVQPKPIALYLWEPFNRPDHSLSLGRDDNKFNKDESSKMIVSAPKQAKLDSIPHVLIQYTMHHAGKDATILAGLSIISISGLCPPCKACPNRNLFQHFFGIEFHFDSHTYFCAISTYKFTRCFNLIESIQYRLSPHEKYWYGLDALMPACTLA
jgi:hypothetical protein